MDELKNVLQARRQKSPASQDFEHQNSCAYIKTLCETCTCTKCQSGVVLFMDEDGFQRSRQCVCQKIAFNHNYLKKQGLSELAERCTLETYETPEPWQMLVKSRAAEYLEGWRYNWFFISGQSGSGKTHIATAIVSKLAERGTRFKYLRWVPESTRLKSLVNTEDYQKTVDAYIQTDLLYVDDFLKNSPSEADMRLSFELLDGRYVARKPVIISTERSLQSIRSLPNFEALAGRIYELTDSGRFCLELSGSDKNIRFRRT